VRAFQRVESTGLSHNADFNRQMGNARTGAAQIIFLDSPYLLDRGYKTAMPYVSLISMFNKELAAQLKDKQLPTDLAWLAPMGTWSCVITPDSAGIEGYSVSGIGNQGIFLTGALSGSASVLQMIGVLPKTNTPSPVPPATMPVTGNPPATPPAATNPPTADTISGPPPATTNVETTPPVPPLSAPAPTPTPATNSVSDVLAPSPEPACFGDVRVAADCDGTPGPGTGVHRRSR